MHTPARTPSPFVSALPPLNLPGISAAARLSLLTLMVISGSPSYSEAKASASPAGLASTYSQLPLSFAANQGQADKEVRFIATGQGYTLAMTDTEAVLALSKKGSFSSDVLRMQVEGASRGLRAQAADKLPGKVNYFIGQDVSKWHASIPTYATVRYAGVYPGIDLIYYGRQRQLEYDFVLAPRADASLIRLRFEGAKQLKFTDNGDVVIVAANGEVAFHKPVVYQDRNGRREAVEGSFQLLSSNSLGFHLGDYDHSRSLVIDPSLAYSTYLGGTGGDQGVAVAVDSSGSAYVTGSTASIGFPHTPSAFQRTNRAAAANGENVFVTKYTPDASAIVYSTYIGGTTNDTAAGIAVNSTGNVFVTGRSDSLDYPVTSTAFQKTNGTGSEFSPNAFVTELSATGSSLKYSTYLGGNNYDFATAIAVDSTNHAYVTGFAGSLNFPTTSGAYQRQNGTGQCVFVTKLNTVGTGLTYSTFIVGGSDDHSTSIAVNAAGNAYVAGYTESTFYPVTSGAFQTTNHSGGNTGFVTELSTTGSSLKYSTYFGGSRTGDRINGIALDSSGNAYLTGQAQSIDFPVTSGAFKTVNPTAGGTGFVAKLNSTGTALSYSTYLGGTDSQFDRGNAIAVNASGAAYVVGQAYSTNFPVANNPYQSTNRAAQNNTSNAFLAKLASNGSSLSYSTYLGGTGNSSQNGDVANGIAVDLNSSAYLTGTTYSTNFPLLYAHQTTNKSPSTGTAFVSKFIFLVPVGTSTTLSSSANPVKAGVNVTFTATVKASSGSGVPTGNVLFSVDGTAVATVTLSSTGKATYSTSSLSVGSHTITAKYSGDPKYSVSTASKAENVTQN